MVHEMFSQVLPHVGLFCSFVLLDALVTILAIKTGRYTHEKKARDIEEVKKIKIDVLGVSCLFGDCCISICPFLFALVLFTVL